MMFKFSKRSVERMKDVDVRLIAIASRAIEITSIDFGIPEFGGLRDEVEQYNLFKKGKSLCDGYHLESYHQSGLALDVYAYVDGKASWEREHLALVGCAMLQAAAELGYKLRWGGHFKAYLDMPHFEIRD